MPASVLWCSQVESNYRFSLTKTVLYHLTMGAYYMRIYGAHRETRTPDLRFTKPLLYQLSYVGIGCKGWSRTTCLQVMSLARYRFSTLL